MTEKPAGRTISRQEMLELAKTFTELGSRPVVVTKPRRRRSETTDFATLKGYREILKQRAVADVIGIENPYFRLHEGQSGATCLIDGRTYSNFLSYDYLGLNGEYQVSAAAKAAIDVYGTSVSASRPTAGDRRLHRNLDQAIAELYEAEDALSFVSGHATNVSVVGELLGKGDLVLFDALCHNSVVLGTKLSDASRISFPHNDMAALESILEKSRHQYDRVLIVVEGLYSMDGDIANLPKLVDIKERYSAWLMVDEAHALGVLGKTGRGTFEHFDIPPDRVDIWMGTLSKTLSACGGYIAGCRNLIDILRFKASAFMFSVGISPPVAAAAQAALELMKGEPDRVAALQENGRLFLDACRAAKLDVGLSAGYAVCVVIVGDSIRAGKLAERLYARGVNSFPVTYPAVPMRAARLRFFLTSKHSKAQIKQAVEILRDEFRHLQRENFGLAKAAAAAKYITT